MGEYRVNLDVYNGPMDLLLYLIRREEVDIYDIPIARVTEQYLGYVGLLKQIDPDIAGEFMVLAATLMEIKTRMLLPKVAPEEGGEEGLEIDPRAELVRQLLEYKAFKDAAADLREAAEIQGLKFPRSPTLDETESIPEIDLEDVQVWDLLDAFSKLMASIGKDVLDQEVIYDDTPVELHATDILDRLQREGPLTFRSIFEGRTLRSEIVGLFLALLELVRQRTVLAAQDANFDEINISLNPNPPSGTPGEEDGSGEGVGEKERSEADAKRQADDGGLTSDREVGEYIPEATQGSVESKESNGVEQEN
jgi:segregation and condensation protein A